jgi:hypothetical protein
VSIPSDRKTLPWAVAALLALVATAYLVWTPPGPEREPDDASSSIDRAPPRRARSAPPRGRDEPRAIRSLGALDGGARSAPIVRARAAPAREPSPAPEHPAVIALDVEPPTPEVQIERTEIMQYVVEDRIATLNEQAHRERELGHEARATRIERQIARLEAERPNLRAHLDELHREAGEAPSDEAASDEAPSAPAP